MEMTFAHWVDVVHSVLSHSNTGDEERHRPLVRLFSFLTGPNGLISPRRQRSPLTLITCIVTLTSIPLGIFISNGERQRRL